MSDSLITLSDLVNINGAGISDAEIPTSYASKATTTKRFEY